MGNFTEQRSIFAEHTATFKLTTVCLINSRRQTFSFWKYKKFFRPPKISEQPIFSLQGIEKREKLLTTPQIFLP